MPDIDEAARSLAKIGATGAPQRNKQPEIIESKVLIIVENKAYLESIQQLLGICGIDIQDVNFRCSKAIKSVDREEDLLRELRTNIKSSNLYSHILCIADGDDNPKEQFGAICKALTEEQYEANNLAFGLNGTIISAKDKPSIGIWVMPNNKDKGTFADFYLTSALLDNKLIQNIENVLEQNKRDKLIKFKNTYTGAAKYFTYLAWQRNPASLDEGMFSKEKFNPKNRLFVTFKEWINSVLNYEQ